MRPNYSDRLKQFQMHSLESVAMKIDVMTLYKLTHNLIDSPIKGVSSSHRPTRFVFRSAVNRNTGFRFFIVALSFQ